MPAIHVSLRSWRKRADLTQSELAERLGLTQAAISKWEKGHRIGLGRIQSISRALKLSASERRRLHRGVLAQYGCPTQLAV